MNKVQNTKHKIPNNKGITLVALVITIIVLIILAVVAIGTLQNHGIINYAKNARVDYAAGEEEENLVLGNYLAKLEENVPNGSSDEMVGPYGQSVEYSKDLNGNGNYTDDWKLFYSEGDTAYIIAADYLPNSLIPNGTAEENKLNMSKSNTYGVYWNTDGSSFRAGKASDTITTDTANKYKLSWFSDATKDSTNENARATADLLNVTAWTAQFGNENDNRIQAIGAPTLEMWVASWNAMGESHGTDKYVKLYATSDSTGYSVGEQKYTMNIVVDLKTSTEGYNNELYFPQKSEVDNCVGYWLASPMYSPGGESGRDLVVVYGSGTIFADGTVNHSSFSGLGLAVRPVVSIPSELLVKNTDGSLKVNV